MSARVHVSHHKVALALDIAGEGGVIGLGQKARYKLRVCEGVHDPGDEVPAKTLFGGDVNVEGGGGEGSIGNAAAACAAGDVEAVLFGGRDYFWAVAAEREVWAEDGGVVDGGRIWGVGSGIKAPVPVGLGAFVAAFGAEGLFIGGNEVAVPEDEVADPVNVGLLLSVHGVVVVEAVDGAWEAGYGGCVCEAEDAVEVGFLLAWGELSPVRVVSL